MPKSKKNKSDVSGLRFLSVTQSESKKAIGSIVNQLLLILLTMFGVTYSFIGSFQLKVLPETIGIFLLFFIGVFILIYSLKKPANYLLYLLLICFCVFCVIEYRSIIQGFILTVNQIMQTYTKHTDYLFYTYIVEPNTQALYTRRSTEFLLCVLFLLSGIISYAIMHRKSFLTVVFLTLPFPVSSMVVFIIPPLIPLFMLLTAWTALFAQRVSIHPLYKKKIRHKKTNLSNQHDVKSSHQISLTMIVAASLCLIVLSTIISEESLIRPKSINELRSQLIESPQKIKNILNKTRAGGISAGDLKSCGDIKFNGSIALKVKSTTKESMYLRGFVGATYTGSRWEPLQNDVYQQNANKFRMNDKPFSPLNQTAAYLQSGHTTPKSHTVTIQTVSADHNYIYSPYALTNLPNSLPNIQFLNDSILTPGSNFKANSYTLNAYQQENRNFFMHTENLALTIEEFFRARKNYNYINFNQSNFSDYPNYELAYSNFVYDHYTDLPVELKEKVINICNNEYEQRNDPDYLERIRKLNHSDYRRFISNQRNSDLSLTISDVKYYLKNHAQYTLSPGATPENRDFVDYFLFDNHKGYCVHFASAAVVMFRSMGIPARYVEGYVVNSNDWAKTDSNGFSDIPDSHAHAWAEVYANGYGWVPVETTPGFASGFDLSNNAGDNHSETEQEYTSKPISSTPESSSSNPQVSSAISKKPNELPSEKENIASKLSSDATSQDKKAIFIPILLILLFIATLLAILLGNRQYALKKRRQKFHQKNRNMAILAVYSYILKICEYLGYKNNKKISVLDFAKQTANSCYFIQEEEFVRISELALKARFSQHQMKEEEFLLLQNFANKLVNDVYTSMPWYKKLVFRYLKHLN